MRRTRCHALPTSAAACPRLTPSSKLGPGQGGPQPDASCWRGRRAAGLASPWARRAIPWAARGAVSHLQGHPEAHSPDGGGLPLARGVPAGLDGRSKPSGSCRRAVDTSPQSVQLSRRLAEVCLQRHDYAQARTCRPHRPVAQLHPPLFATLSRGLCPDPHLYALSSNGYCHIANLQKSR